MAVEDSVRRTPLLSACCLLALSLAWLDPVRDRIAAGNRLFAEGDYEAAVEKYGQSLVEDPDSPLLNFNMGAAHYKAGNYTDAIASFGRVRTEGHPHRGARTAYNVGNAHYRVAASAEDTDPQQALQSYAAALVSYRRAIAQDAGDENAKFNYEFAARKLEELQKKLQEEQEQQEQQPDNQEQQQQEPEQQPQSGEDEQAGDEQPQESPSQQEGQEDTQGEQSQGGTQEESQPDSGPQAQPDGATAEASEAGEMSPQEASALLDTARDDEIQPEEFARQVQGAAVAEPAQDW
jgi:Ca-activated chloride channel family protein